MRLLHALQLVKKQHSEKFNLGGGGGEIAYLWQVLGQSNTEKGLMLSLEVFAHIFFGHDFEDTLTIACTFTFVQ